ncbi:helix-turn-helix domain-containing protein [Streptomyces scabiei]|uniref:helix-turn-helix domain-containing protein n=1 Tax=Streptomyces scabiei TaxID=1930 RepID=UPI001B322942|nr:MULTISPECIES: helix-turn-helix transcriptional regulator [Streptomyces]MBP5891978.1 helix-turn-helix transcriptional regulator [Streptomyces sp. LBUM 1481]MBP5922213.1 helix-turn-helix transcriptional regulator [Streptomyces sp. LBUM 1483]MDX2687470.1 helix-turn-helix transcriptional regulator [Streptomyces scabiei]MDX2752515.1 helix-turn-helix transcriptional regulator [Streptomyces scabiei]MDX2806697.1 helix-turn-helix transcriptional regulator [Streptomyces scabiei]
MPPRSLEIGPAGMQPARAIEILRAERGLSQRQLADRVTALGHPMSNTMLSRIERAQRRCDVDDLVAIAEALHVPAPAPLPSLRAV